MSSTSSIASSSSEPPRTRLYNDENNGQDFSCKREERRQASPAKKRLKTMGEEAAEGALRQLSYSDKTQTNDEIHQSIELCPVTKAFVDTKVFQRLRHIHQLGTSQYVYMCGDHNRFQHSLGVAHLAEKMCRNIKSEQPALGATEKDVLCVKLAGLLHDLGHGPFSHLYEEFRLHRLPRFLETYPELKEQYGDCMDYTVPDHWCHEDSSLIMLDAALEELGLQIDQYNLDQPLKQIGYGPKNVDARSMKVFKPPNTNDCILTSRDFVFIKECIYGKPLKENDGRFVGRKRKELEWLYDIVNNRHNGLDVDKIDYYARDHNRTIGSTHIDIKMIEDARVAKGECGRPDKCPTCHALNPGQHFMLCYPKKRIEATMSFFQQRLKLHTTVYQHKKATAVGCMLLDIFCEADPFFRLKTPDGKKFPISRAPNRSEFLLRLRDDVLALIANSDDDRLKRAQALIERINEHDMYKCAVDKSLDVEEDASSVDSALENSHKVDKLVYDMDEHEIQSGLLLEARHWEVEYGFTMDLKSEDFVVEKYCMHHGAKNGNPLDRMRFFEEMNEKLFGPITHLPVATAPTLSDYKCMNPATFQKVGLRIYCRDERKKGDVNQVFNQWFMGVKEREAGNSQITPYQIEGYAAQRDEDDAMEQEYDQQEFRGYAAVPLSQDSLDDSNDYNHFDVDESPVPLKRKG